jgi:hypothetical protein
MNSKLIMPGIFLFLQTGAYAGTWIVDASAKLTTALNTYSSSWEGGEAGSFTWGSQFLGTAERQLSAKVNIRNTLNLQFGQTKVQDEAAGRWSAPQKSVDLIDALAMLRFTLGAWVEPFVSVRAISQFLDGRDPLVVRYVNPIDLTEAAGVSRTIKKSETVEWSARAGAAVRQLIDSSDVTNDGGVEFTTDLKASNSAKWVSFISSLRIYEAFFSSKADAFEAQGRKDVWRHPHVRWENTLTVTFARYLMLGLTAYAYYDKEISTSVRLKEAFSAGLTYIYAKK